MRNFLFVVLSLLAVGCRQDEAPRTSLPAASPVAKPAAVPAPVAAPAAVVPPVIVENKCKRKDTMGVVAFDDLVVCSAVAVGKVVLTARHCVRAALDKVGKASEVQFVDQKGNLRSAKDVLSFRYEGKLADSGMAKDIVAIVLDKPFPDAYPVDCLKETVLTSASQKQLIADLKLEPVKNNSEPHPKLTELAFRHEWGKGGLAVGFGGNGGKSPAYRENKVRILGIYKSFIEFGFFSAVRDPGLYAVDASALPVGPGDSGGALFEVQEDSSLKLAGIISQGGSDGDFLSVSIATNLKWVKENLE